MKSCNEYELLINLYLDDMLSPLEEQELKTHLRNCSHCRELYRQLNSIKTALGTLEEPAPAELHQRILSYVEANRANATDKVKPFRMGRWLRCAAGIAACLLLVVTAARFVPSLDLAAPENAAQEAAPGLNMPMLDSPEPDYRQDVSDSENSIVIVPSQDAVVPGYTGSGDKNSMEEVTPSAPEETGQLSVDLPPLATTPGGETTNSRKETVRKWIKVTGKRDAMPEWVDWSSVFETELEGERCEYLQIAHWAETLWMDHLIASGFTVETLEGDDLSENGTSLLLFFFLE